MTAGSFSGSCDEWAIKSHCLEDCRQDDLSLGQFLPHTSSHIRSACVVMHGQ